MPPSLSSDVIDYLLTSLSDSGTLLSTILVSKSFYEVFQAHPSSILTSVATNQISPELLPCAIRLAHFNRDEYLASRADYVQNFPLEQKFSHNEAQAVTPHLATLIKNDDVVTEMELFFSTMCVLPSIHPRGCTNGCIGNRCKDRTSGTRSLLSPCESLRFRRALYRWWLLIYLFPARYLRPTRTAGGNADDEGSDTEDDVDDDDDDDDTDDDTGDDDDDDDNDNDGIDGADTDDPNVYHAKVQGLRKEFLSEFSDEEVAEMWQIDNFMMFVSSCARNVLLYPPPLPPIHDCVLLRSIHSIRCTYLNFASYPIMERSCHHCESPPDPSVFQQAEPSFESRQLGLQLSRRELARDSRLSTREKLRYLQGGHEHLGPRRRRECNPGRQG